jgi:hypothetical protein
MKKLKLLLFLSFNAYLCFGQQLSNGNFELWTTESYGQEPNNWLYDDGTGLVYGTNNIIRSLNGTDPITTTKISGAQAFGGNGNSVLLETKSAVGSQMLSNGYTTIPGYLYRQEAFSNPNAGSISFKYKATVVNGDSCLVRAGLLDVNYNLVSYGEFWIKPSNNSTSWQSKTLILENLSQGNPTEIFVEAISTYDINYLYNTPIIGSKLYLDNFTINYCSTPTTSNVSETICNYMLPYTWNGVTFNSQGTQSVTLTSALGCDSIVNMNLTVVSGPYTQVPDPNFEQKLIDLGYDPCGVVDGQVPTNLINGVTSLNIQNINVSDFTGIEDFIALQNLTIRYAQLQTNGIDLSNNIQLKSLIITDSYLTNLDLSQNINLETLELYAGSGFQNNDISILDLTNNINLVDVHCGYSGIQSLLLPSSTALTNLSCYNNYINSLNLSFIPNLQTLNAENNYLISLGTTVQNSLNTMNLKNNKFTGLNLKDFSALKSIDCSNNLLECLNLKNGINNQFTSVKTNNNFNLLCIEVDDSTYSTNNPLWNTNKDAWSSYNEDCPGLCFTADVSENKIDQLTIFPNPVSDILEITTDLKFSIIEIINMDGRIDYVQNSSNKIDFSNYNSGIYILRFITKEGNIHVQKLIKN